MAAIKYEPIDAELPEQVEKWVEQMMLSRLEPESVQAICGQTEWAAWKYAARGYADRLAIRMGRKLVSST